MAADSASWSRGRSSLLAIITGPSTTMSDLTPLSHDSTTSTVIALPSMSILTESIVTSSLTARDCSCKNSGDGVWIAFHHEYFGSRER